MYHWLHLLKSKTIHYIDMAIITNNNKVINTYGFNLFNKMTIELTPYLSEVEVDKLLDFMVTIQDSKYDINPTATDCKTQVKLILGNDRYEQVVEAWKQNNQKVLSVFGTLKYKNKIDTTDKTLYDGLDPTDNPDDWEKVYV